jgi:hypothetical protein
MSELQWIRQPEWCLVQTLNLTKPDASYQRRLDVAFFLLVPLLLAALMAVVGRYVDALGLTGGILYVAALSCVPWWLAGLVSHLAHRLLAARTPPAWLIGAIGVLVSLPLAALYSHAITAWFHASWPGGELLAHASWANWLDRTRDIALAAGRATALWVSFVVIFGATLDWRRYGYPAARPAEAAPLHTGNRLANSGTVWTAADDQQLTQLAADGLAPQEIAARKKRTTAAIKSRMSRTGLR